MCKQGIQFRKNFCTLILLATAATMSGAQAQGGQTTADSQAPGQAPTASDGETSATTADNLPGVDPGQTQGPSNRRSFFLAGLHIAENGETIPGSAPGSSSQISSITNVLGSLHLLSLQRRSETAIDYVGGIEVSNIATFLGSTVIQIHQLNAEQHFLWRRRELTLVDNLGDLPGGDFGSTWFGGAGLYDLGNAGVNANLPTSSNLSNFFGSTVLGGSGGSQITNVSLAEYTEVLTRRSSVTIIGGYGMTDNSGNPGLINSQVIGAQASYSYQLNRQDQVGFSYGFRNLRFPEPGEGTIDTNSLELTYGHKISRMSLALSAGPEFVKLSDPPFASTKQVNVSGDASGTYLLRNARLAVGCDKLVTSGSGLYAGANTDTCQLSLVRLAHKWSIGLDTGYAKLVPIGQILNGVPTQAYQYAFVGAALDRELGQHFGAFASYQFNNQSFGNSLCSLSGACNLIAKHTFSVGIDLRTRPRHLE
jgi:hypothetical protein